ncbi:DUF4407 domain-containing protein [Pontibacter sp. G13]|uniref:DUF4407 domain-containing protein n=1 Tax=Pontibacter sp. G13 TaxID=3074898 RepID=UPI00288A1115|nr:DUF4407 domain-containing protein [Pontibacter sp. G13]WNJ16736.1 DUF4407 domain-containing protein [Pontibacter sp. G13]
MSEYYNNEAIEEVQEKPGPVKRFFFACAGAYLKVLEACPSEHTKYVGIGATIFLTACLAVISGTFAIHTLADNLVLSIFFGILWGALIFNLDRYIVSSIRKEGRFWYEFGLALPRLILAILISLVITKPIEVQLFDNQIGSALNSYVLDLQKKATEQVDQDLGLLELEQQLHDIDSLRQEYKRLKEGKPTSFDFGEVSAEYTLAKNTYDSLNRVYTPRIKANERRRSELWSKYAKKVYETGPNGEQKFVRWDFDTKWQQQSNNLFKINKRLQEELDQRLADVNRLEGERRGARDRFAKDKEEELALLNQRREELVAEKERIEVDRPKMLAEAQEKARKYGVGFPAKIEALERMKEDDSTIWWMSNLIMLLFIMLETSPVFVKLITKRGPYDFLLSRIEHHKKVESLKYISDMNYALSADIGLQSRNFAENANGVAHGEEVFMDN